jgi:HSP20 family protein
MDQDDKAPLIRRRIIKAVQQGLAEAWDDPYWAQLEDAEDDTRVPPMDIQDRDDHYLLVIEMPGIPREKVDVNVKETLVEISGENALECDIDHADLAYLCNERTTTNFRRNVPLPGPVVPDGAEANLKDGVLVVRLPKKVEVEAQSVSLTVS